MTGQAEQQVEAKPQEPLPMPKADGKGDVLDESVKKDDVKGSDAKSDDGELTPEVKSWAKDLGVDEADLEGMSVDQAERMLRREERRLESVSERAAGRKKTDSETETKSEEPKKAETGRKRFEFSEKFKAFDEDFQSELTKMRDHYETELDKVHERESERTKSEQQREYDRQERQFYNEVEDAIGKISELSEVFGEGSADDLADNSPELAAREQVAQEVKLRMAAYYRAGMKIPKVADLVRREARGLFGDRMKGSMRKEIVRSLERRSEGSVEAPSHRKSEAERPMTPRERDAKALRVLDAKLKKSGMS